jgi:glucose/arabinose dehydrogenase
VTARCPARRVLSSLVALGLAGTLLACSDDAATTTTGGDEPTPATSGGGSVMAAPGTAAIELRPIAELDSPVALAPHPVTGDLYVAEQGGAVRRIEIGDEGGRPTFTVDRRPALDLTAETEATGERGLLGLAFSPDGEHLYVDYTDLQGDTHVVEYRMDGPRADPGSARQLLFVDQPYPNHNGGQLVTDAEGHLYIGMGDGGAAGDPQNRAQNLDDLLGKILRIDPAGAGGGRPYGIPADNPFVDGGGRPEIWIWGVRNPWRFSFDRETGDLWVADVGQNDVEEINLLPATAEGTGAGPARSGPPGRGANLGWRYKEGTRPFQGTPPEGLSLVDPVSEYEHRGTDCSVTGGFVYRGTAVPALRGVYVYGDYCTAELRGLVVVDGREVDDRSLGVSVAENSLSSFGEDLDGELYVLSTEGTVYRIEPA